MYKPWPALVAMALALLASPAFADIYKCRDSAGKPFYTLTPPKYCTAPRAAARSLGSGSPSDFPRVDMATQKTRDSSRRSILETELATEQQQLQLAKSRQDENMTRIHSNNIQLLSKEIASVR